MRTEGQVNAHTVASQSVPVQLKSRHKAGPGGVIAYNQWPGVAHARQSLGLVNDI